MQTPWVGKLHSESDCVGLGYRSEFVPLGLSPGPHWSSGGVPRICGRLQQNQGRHPAGAPPLRPQDRFGGRGYSATRTYLLPFEARARHASGVHRREPSFGVHTPVELPLRSSRPLRQEEGRFASSLRGLPGLEQDHPEGPLPPTPRLGLAGCTTEGPNLYEDRPPARLQPSPHRPRRRVEDRVSDSLWVLRMVSHAVRTF